MIINIYKMINSIITKTRKIFSITFFSTAKISLNAEVLAMFTNDIALHMHMTQPIFTRFPYMLVLTNL